MAARAVPITTCDRCPIGRELVATSTRRFSLDGEWSEIDLCEKHDDALVRDLMVWQRLARSTTAVRVQTTFDREEREEARRAAELRTRQAQADAAAREAAAIAEAAAAAPEPKRNPQGFLIPGAFEWRLTTHAREQAETRGFTEAEVLTCAAQPEQTYRQPKYGPHAAIHQRGELAVAVDTKTKCVITALHRTQDQYDPTATRSQIRKSS